MTTMSHRQDYSTKSFLLIALQKPTAQDKLMQLYTMGPEPDRRAFLENLFSFNEDKGSPITAMPQVSKQPLDLYKLYMQVREKGGMVEVRGTCTHVCTCSTMYGVR